MSNHDVLSSQQALDDYFCALLGEDLEADEPDNGLDLLARELLSAEPEPEWQPTKAESYPFWEASSAELEAPNLEDVERLLSQLESTNVVDESDIDDILAQNTIAIAQQTKPATTDDIPSVEKLADTCEEIQEWAIEESVTECIQPDAVAIESYVEQVIDSEPQVDMEPETQTGSVLSHSWESTQRTENFQVLYFDVNGVMFAVPLDELGGIHRITELNHLIGKPSWYLGLQTNREHKFDVVDTAKWVMADKLRDQQYRENYQYVVMLGESTWGLASNQLMGTETLNVDKVRWRELAGKRPWLAGMVKEKMCALIHVQALIDMLNAGLDVKSMN